MSPSEESVLQQKDDTDCVLWKDFGDFQKYVDSFIAKSTDALEKDVQAIQLKIADNKESIDTLKTQVTTVQTTMDTLVQSVTALRLTVEQQQRQPLVQEVDDDRVFNDYGHHGGHAAGNPFRGGHAGRGRGNAYIGAQHVPFQAHDDGLGKPKF